MQAFEEAANLSQQSSVSMWSLMDDESARTLKRSRSLRYTHYDNTIHFAIVCVHACLYVCMCIVRFEMVILEPIKLLLYAWMG